MLCSSNMEKKYFALNFWPLDIGFCSIEWELGSPVSWNALPRAGKQCVTENMCLPWLPVSLTWIAIWSMKWSLNIDGTLTAKSSMPLPIWWHSHDILMTLLSNVFPGQSIFFSLSYHMVVASYLSCLIASYHPMLIHPPSKNACAILRRANFFSFLYICC